MRKKAIVASLAGAAAVTLLAGCATTGGDSPTAGADVCAATTPTEITFWHTYSTDNSENDTLTKTIIPEFEKECPGVKVDAVVMPADGLHDQLIAAVSAGGLPDVMRMDIIWTPEFAKLGALQAIDDYAGAKDLESQVLPGPLSTNEYKGATYGLPLDTNTQVLVYNKDLISTPPASFDDLAKLAPTLAKGVSVVSLGGAGGWNVFPWFWSAGGSVTNDDHTKATGYLDSAASVSALQQLVTFYDEGIFGASTTGGSPDSWGGFTAGNYASLTDGPWLVATFDSQMHLGEAKVPSGSGGSISVVGGENIVTFATSQHKDAAWAFQKFMLGDFAQEAMSKAGQIPVTQDALKTAVADTPYLATYVDQLQNAQARTPVPVWTQMDPIITDAFMAAFKGTKTPQQALSDAAGQIDALLADD